MRWPLLLILIAASGSGCAPSRNQGMTSIDLEHPSNVHVETRSTVADSSIDSSAEQAPRQATSRKSAGPAPGSQLAAVETPEDQSAVKLASAEELSFLPPDDSENSSTPADKSPTANTAPELAPAPQPLMLPPSGMGPANTQDFSASSDAPAAAPGSRPNEPLPLEAVISSVYSSYPLLESAFFQRNIASGDRLSASGEFDLKLKGASENEPIGFYRNYRQSIGFVQPLKNGSDIIAGYRVGNGHFEPWYKERETNEGGEFKAGVVVPLSQDRQIDPRRAGVMRTNLERQQVEPDIQAQLIGFIQEGSYAYWEWVAAGTKYRIAARILDLAAERTDRIGRQVEEGLLDPPQLTDNLRLVAERRVVLAESDRKLQQTAVKLSLFFRDINGQPMIPAVSQLPNFPELQPVSLEQVELDAQIAAQVRPEIAVLNFTTRQLSVDLAQAENELRPTLDAVLMASQDFGQPTSSLNDKGEFEFDASIYLDVPLQRRKAKGKIQAIQGKMAQVSAKRRMTSDKIVSEVRIAYANLTTALEQARQAEEAVRLAEDLAQRERRNFDLGASDLLTVTLREQYAFESALKAIDAKLYYFQAQADYRAAMGQDQVP